MICTSIRKNINKVCTSDFNKRVKIQTTSISANNAPSGLASVGFADILSVWALVKTSSNREFIEGVNIENGLNTDFFIRYNSSVDFERQLWIEYNDSRFKITNVDNIDKENKIIRLRSTEKGNKSILANSR